MVLRHLLPGRALAPRLSARAVREDETAAACAGINVVAIRSACSRFGAAIAAIGGGLYATYLSFVNADNFNFHLALISIFYVAVGGTERFTGRSSEPPLLTILPELLRPFGDWRMIVYGLTVLAIVVLFPRGLVGEVWPLLKRSAQRVRGAPSGFRGGAGLMLGVAGLSKSFGGLVALSGLDLEVRTGEVVA